MFPFGLNGELEMHLEGGGAFNFCNCFERRRLGKLAGETEGRSELRSVCGSLLCSQAKSVANVLSKISRNCVN